MLPNVQFVETGFRGLVEIIPTGFTDERGFFRMLSQRMDACLECYAALCAGEPVVLKKGVVRGLHFQRGIYAQAKLVRVVHGRVLDVVVDLRKDEPTFGKSFTLELDADKHNQLYIPAGFAHGLAALEDSVFFYKCSTPYHKQSDGGILWNDEELNIEWPFTNPIISAKDQQLPRLQELLRNSVI